MHTLSVLIAASPDTAASCRGRGLDTQTYPCLTEPPCFRTSATQWRISIVGVKRFTLLNMNEVFIQTVTRRMHLAETEFISYNVVSV